MVILNESTRVQRFTFIPTRLNDANYMILKNETTGEVTTSSIYVRKESYYSYFDAIFDLKEGHFYTVTLQFYGVIGCKLDYYLAHRDKIFCTNQTVETYSINKTEYVANEQNIIFYE